MATAIVIRQPTALLAALTIAVVAARAGRAGDVPRACLAPSPTYEVLNWSDGNYQLCAPPTDSSGTPYPPDLQLRCTVYIGLQKVAVVPARPGQILKGPHGRTGSGIATATCETADGLKSQPAPPREVLLSPP